MPAGRPPRSCRPRRRRRRPTHPRSSAPPRPGGCLRPPPVPLSTPPRLPRGPAFFFLPLYHPSHPSPPLRWCHGGRPRPWWPVAPRRHRHRRRHPAGGAWREPRRHRCCGGPTRPGGGGWPAWRHWQWLWRWRWRRRQGRQRRALWVAAASQWQHAARGGVGGGWRQCVWHPRRRRGAADRVVGTPSGRPPWPGLLPPCRRVGVTGCGGRGSGVGSGGGRGLTRWLS